MRELSCFGDSSVGVAAAASVSGRGALDRALQAATTSVYRASLSSGKEMLVRVTWTRSAAGAAGVAVAFDEEGVSPAPSSSSSRKSQLVLQKRRGSRSLVTGAGTVVGVHWDTAEAKYDAAESSSPEPGGGDYYLAVGRGRRARAPPRRRRRGAGALPPPRPRRSAAPGEPARAAARRGGGARDAVQVPRGRGGARGGGGGEGELRVSIDGEKVAEVRRLRWGFRGNRAAVLADGEVVDVMWDVHDWWFGRRDDAGTGAQFMVKARAEKEGRLWMAEDTAVRGHSPAGFFLHVQCYRRIDKIETKGSGQRATLGFEEWLLRQGIGPVADVASPIRLQALPSDVDRVWRWPRQRWMLKGGVAAAAYVKLDMRGHG
ncbi:hypothetical protein EJB05_47672, partial [Eragrostis curvula]